MTYLEPIWKSYVDTFSEDTPILEIVAACMNRYGDAGKGLSFSDWGRMIRLYIKEKETNITEVQPTSLRGKILLMLRDYPAQKAIAIASRLKCKRSEVNSVLYKLKAEGKCRVNKDYQWSLVEEEIPLFCCEPVAEYGMKVNVKDTVDDIDEEKLKSYLGMFSKLKVSNRDGQKALHKYVLLIAIMQLIGKGMIQNIRFASSIEIENRFNKIWDEYVPSDSPFRPGYSIPFWHMMSEPFWRLYDKMDNRIDNQWEHSITSVKKQRKEITAEIDEDLFLLAKDNVSRNKIIDHLAKHIIKRSNESIMPINLCTYMNK